MSSMPKSVRPFLRSKMPELDLLRGVACLMVLFFHGFAGHFNSIGLSRMPRLFVQTTAYGWTGVNLFFALSGFLITGILIESRQESGYYRRFYIRRALRILPPYLAVIVALIILSQARLINHPAGWAFIGLSLLYLSNITDYFGVPIQYRVLWSLAVEEHFYLLWPTCIRRLKLRGTAIVAVAICVAPLLCRMISSRLGHNPLGFETWFCADGLGMGALLAVTARMLRKSRLGLWLFAGGGLLLSAGCYLLDRIVGHVVADGSFHITAFNSFCCACVTVTLLLGSRFSIRQRMLEFFGEISYGLYLVHMLCFDFYDRVMPKIWPAISDGHGHFGLMVVRFLTVSAVAVGLSTVSRRYYEDPILRLKGRLAPSEQGKTAGELPPKLSGVCPAEDIGALSIPPPDWTVP